jgi:hypothetical protein
MDSSTFVENRETDYKRPFSEVSSITELKHFMEYGIEKVTWFAKNAGRSLWNIFCYEEFSPIYHNFSLI